MSLTQTILRSPAVAALTSPHGVDRYLEVVNPMWSVNEVRARVVDVSRETDDVATLTLRPSGAWRGFRAGQNVLVGIEISGARRTRCFSISSAESPEGSGTAGTFTITVRAYDEGLVSTYLARTARPGRSCTSPRPKEHSPCPTRSRSRRRSSTVAPGAGRAG